MVTKAEVIYRARCNETGEIWECENLKTIIHCLEFAFNADLHRCKFFDTRTCLVEYGVLIYMNDGTTQFKSLKGICFVYGSGILNTVNRARVIKY